MKPKSKRELYDALRAEGWSSGRIAMAFGVSRQAVKYQMSPHISAELKFHASVRDRGVCSLCGEHTRGCKVIDESKPVTLDNIGLLCRDCSIKRTWAAYHVEKVPKVCGLPGCSNPRPIARKYCSPECIQKSLKARVDRTQARWDAITERTCTRCKQTKPRAEFYVLPQKYARILSASCKLCHNRLTYEGVQKIRAEGGQRYERFLEKQIRAQRKYAAKVRAQKPVVVTDPKVIAILDRLRNSR